MFFDYYEKIIAEQQKKETLNTESETNLKKAKKLAKKKQVEVFEDIDGKETSTETEQIEETESGE